MQKPLILLIVASAVTFAAVIGARMSPEAMGVVIGVVCGASAGIPVSLLLLAAMQRRQHLAADDWSGRGAMSPGSYPPVVVIQGGQPSTTWPGLNAHDPLQPPFYGAAVDASPREFRVVGGEG